MVHLPHSVVVGANLGVDLIFELTGWVERAQTAAKRVVPSGEEEMYIKIADESYSKERLNWIIIWRN